MQPRRPQGPGFRHGEVRQKTLLVDETGHPHYSPQTSPCQTCHAVASETDRWGPYVIRWDTPSLPTSKHAASIPAPGVDVKEQGDSLVHHV